MPKSSVRIALALGCGIGLALVIALAGGVLFLRHEARKQAEATSNAQQQKLSLLKKQVNDLEQKMLEWQEKPVQSSMDGSVGFGIAHVASNEINGWFAHSRPILAIVCREHKTMLAVATQMNAQPELGLYERHTVRIRLDEGKPERQVWSQGTDGKELFAPNPVLLARQLVKAQVMRFEFTPFNSSSQVAAFNLVGIKDHLSKVATACGWHL